MTRLPHRTASLLVLLAGVAAASDEHPPAAPAADGPHAHAPSGVVLEITEGTRLRAPGFEGFFEALAERFPGRFEHVDELVEADGDMEAGWRDSQGEYELVYDEEEEELVYWQDVSAETLTRGRRDFVQFCASCHGFEGDGYGRSAMALRPPPRDFRQGLFKFAKVPGGKLPTDEGLVELVKRGLDGTPMLPWALSDTQLHDIVQYLKSLSPPEVGWRDVYSEFAGKVDIGADPFAADPAAGVARGEKVYHKIGCYNCHPGYVTPARLAELAEAAPGSTYRADLTYSRVDSASSYTVQGYAVRILPPDFTFHTIRVGSDAREVAETVAAGIPGANMPTWKGSIPDEDIWAIGHYIRHLIDEYKDQPAARAAFMAGLRGGN